MRTLFILISLLVLLIISLILLISLMNQKCSFDRNSSAELNSISFRQKSGSAQNLNSFKKEETESAYNLTYGWMDYEANIHFITFLVTKQQLSEAETEFGYYESELEKYVEERVGKMREEMLARLKESASQLIARSPYPQYILIEEVDSKNFKLKLSVPPPLYKEVKAEFERIRSLISSEQNSHFKKIEKEVEKHKKIFFEKKGFQFIGDTMNVNYELSVQNNRARVKQVIEEMMRNNEKLSLHQFLALILAFIQEVKFGIPPMKENDKWILGFWAPPKVLVNNLGDCDSKAVAFASLWINFKRYPLILIKIPDHMLVGLAIPSITPEGITVNGLRYTLCEVTGPDKMPPGLITLYSQLYLEGGHFRYEMIR